MAAMAAAAAAEDVGDGDGDGHGELILSTFSPQLFVIRAGLIYLFLLTKSLVCVDLQKKEKKMIHTHTHTHDGRTDVSPYHAIATDTDT